MKALLLVALLSTGFAHSDSIVNFSGTMRVNDCSGSLVRYETSKGSDAAMMLTSGKCYEGKAILANDFLQNAPTSLTMTLLNADLTVAGTLEAKKILYASVSISNMALYELKMTFDEIQKQYSIEPFTLAKTSPEKDLSIDILSGLRKTAMSCEINSFPKLLVEGDWTWFDSIYYSTYPVPGCHTREGMEGSPVVQQGTREIVAVDSTRNLASDQRCRLGNPCEVEEDEGYIVFGYQMSYGQPVALIYGCLDEKNQIDLKKEGCQLPPNRTAPKSPYSTN
jgi:hypothetical protein